MLVLSLYGLHQQFCRLNFHFPGPQKVRVRMIGVLLGTALLQAGGLQGTAASNSREESSAK